MKIYILGNDKKEQDISNMVNNGASTSTSPTDMNNENESNALFNWTTSSSESPGIIK